MEFDIEVIWITSFYSLIQARGVALAIVCESSVCHSKKKKKENFHGVLFIVSNLLSYI